MEMRIQKIENKTRRDGIKNATFRKELNIIPIDEKIADGKLRWFGHVCRMPDKRMTKRVHETKVQGKNK